MSTPAQDRGIVLGKEYVIGTINGDAASITINAGDIVRLNEDDETDIPAFDKLDKNGKVSRPRFFMDLNRVTMRERYAEPVKAPAYGVYAHSGSTTFTIARELTAEEVAAILTAAGL